MRGWSAAAVRCWTLLWFVVAGVNCGGGGGGTADASRTGDAGADAPALSDATIGSDVSVDAPAAPSVFKLSETVGVRLQIASDRTGVPVVMWNDPLGNIDSVYWDQAAGAWVPLATLDGSEPLLVDPDGSGHSLVGWDVASDTQPIDGTVRRFDPVNGAWGPLVSLPDPAVASYTWQLAVDGAGNAHSFWRDGDGNDYWSWWQVDGPGWQAAVQFAEVDTLVAVPAATFMWFEQNALGVRQFDPVAGTWSDPVQLADLTKESSLRIHTLAAGRDGAPLMASLRRDPDQLVIEAWRGQPGTNGWSGRELLEAVSVSSDPTVLDGPFGALADPSQDFVWAAVPRTDGTFDLHIERYDPGPGAWAQPWVLGGYASSPSFDLRADGLGRAYGCVSDGLLIQFDPAAPGWQSTQSGIGGGILRTSDGGAFVVGYANGSELVALRSDAAGAWRPARGYPGGAHPSVGSVPYAMEIAGPERALVAWTVAYGPDAGVWAAFLE